MMTVNSKAVVCVGVTAVMGLAIGQRTVEADTILGCRNPAGQVRLIDASETCRPQESLVTWSTEGQQGPPGPEGPAGPEGPVGPQGNQGAPGADAPGVTGGDDHSAPGSGGIAPLSGTSTSPTSLTTENIATGFPRYMVWANVGIEFNSGNPATGTFPSASSASCQLVYTVQGRTGTFFVDGRSVTFPITAFNQNDRIVRFSLGLNGMVGADLEPALSPSEAVDISLNCNSNAGPSPHPAQIPVKAVNWSVTGIGINKTF